MKILPKDSKSVVVIAGPTASGKSALALRLAKILKGWIINGDSLQVYQGFSLLTEQPSEAIQNTIPHFLYAFKAPSEQCTAWEWANHAIQHIYRCHHAGKIPIVVGGTGFYLSALVEGLSPIPPISIEVNESAQALMTAIGPVAFHQLLMKEDPLMAQRLHPHDQQRVLRAWSVLKTTGESLLKWQGLPKQQFDPALRFFKVLILPERSLLYERINKRFVERIEQGAIEELKAFLARYTAGILSPAFHALGASELYSYLQGKISLEEAITQAQTSIRQYAKRQSTWFRHQYSADVILPSSDIAALFKECRRKKEN